jgi:hypothetical protein
MKSPSRSRRILLLLGVTLFIFAATLPWQMRQWKTLNEEREKTRLQARGPPQILRHSRIREVVPNA